MFSVNQMVCYHVLLEAFNVVNNGSSDSIQKKWRPNEPRNYPMRRERKVEVKVNVPAHVSCQGFTREPVTCRDPRNQTAKERKDKGF